MLWCLTLLWPFRDVQVTRVPFQLLHSKISRLTETCWQPTADPKWWGCPAGLHSQECVLLNQTEPRPKLINALKCSTPAATDILRHFCKATTILWISQGKADTGELLNLLRLKKYLLHRSIHKKENPKSFKQTINKRNKWGRGGKGNTKENHTTGKSGLG